MKKAIKIIAGILILGLIGGWIYWQQYKKGIVRNKIENAVSKGTDSLYFIHYDSSRIDAINGNATFFNVDLQSDSLQQQLLKFDTAASATVYNVHIGQVSVKGANIAGLLSNNRVEAKSIELIDPVIYIISSGKKEKEKFTADDTLAIYEKILGRYNTINASQITVTNGKLFMADKTGNPHTSLTGISIQLNNFKVDSTRDYNNIISYFIKDLVAKVGEVKLKTPRHLLTFSGIEYDAPAKMIRLKKFQEVDSSGEIVFDVNNSIVSNISTDAFILNQQIKADLFKTDGGSIKLYRKQNSSAGNEEVTFGNDSFDEIFLKSIDIGNTKLSLYNKNKPNDAPLILNNLRFSATGLERLYSGSNIIELVSKADWKLAADGFSSLSDDKIYKFDVGAFEINSATSYMHVNNFALVPQVTAEAFVKSLKHQTDLYNFKLNDISLSGFNTAALLTDHKLLADNATLEPVLKIFNDRLVPPNTAKKLYPNQQLMAVKLPIFLRKVIIKNGLVEYTERGAISKQKGTVFFKNINATVLNVTNIKEQISSNNILQVNASGVFMGVSKVQTTWKLPLSTGNARFSVTGTATGFNAEALNAIAEPLGMASIEKGKINKLSFNFIGDDVKSQGSSTLLYEDLKVELLKKDSNELKKKGLMSFVANMLAKNSNPQNGILKQGKINFERDPTKSFFNFLWKSVFDGAKSTIQKL
ncbi:hypothetical protein BH11BAC4_BH11BAC4_10210 [soil metagenome]